MSCWEWIRKGQLHRQVAEKHAARSGTGDTATFGTIYLYENIAPTRQEQFRGEGFTWDEVQALIEKCELPQDRALSTVTIVDNQSRSWSGKIASLDWDQVDSTLLWTLTLTMDYPTLL